MKNWNPLLVVFLSFILYCILLVIIAICIDSQRFGGEQYFVTIIAKGIDLFPIFGIIITGTFGFVYRKRPKYYRVIFAILLIALILFEIYILFYNHRLSS